MRLLSIEPKDKEGITLKVIHEICGEKPLTYLSHISSRIIVYPLPDGGEIVSLDNIALVRFQKPMMVRGKRKVLAIIF